MLEAPSPRRSRLLLKVEPWRVKSGDRGKFPAFYHWCFGPTRKQIDRFATAGFAVEHCVAYFGEQSHAPGRLLKKVDAAWTDLMVRHPVYQFTSCVTYTPGAVTAEVISSEREGLGADAQDDPPEGSERGSWPLESWRDALIAVPIGVLLVLLILWTAHDGGYDEDTWYWGALALLALLAMVVGGLFGPLRRLGTATKVALGAMSVSVAWSYVSIAWAAYRGDALTGSNKALMYYDDLRALCGDALDPEACAVDADRLHRRRRRRGGPDLDARWRSTSMRPRCSQRGG